MNPTASGQPLPANLSNTTLAILAGGRGSRMGMPKAHLELRGEPILAWMLKHLRWPGPTMLLTAPAVADPPGAQLFDLRVTDPVDDLGPMRGIASALENTSTEVIAVVTVDMPGITRDVLEWLLKSLAARPQLHGLMCSRLIEQREMIEPFPAVFRSSAKEIVLARLQAGELSVQRLCRQPNFASLASPAEWPASTWMNLNHPGELAAFEAANQNSGARDET